MLKPNFPEELGHLDFSTEIKMLKSEEADLTTKSDFDKAKSKSKGCSSKGIALRCIFHVLMKGEESEHSGETCGGCSNEEEEEKKQVEEETKQALWKMKELQKMKQKG